MVHEQYDAFDLISIRAPARGATRMSNIMFGNFFRFQSALPRGERLFLLLSSCYLLHISIRAPARGATPVAPVQPEPTEISIRAPARGATYRSRRWPELSTNFNPRSREGSDHHCTSHGSTRRNFNPRSREGSDSSACLASCASFAFQSALPRGERLCEVNSCSTSRNFNPRSREGSDSVGSIKKARRKNFNPRSREGSDLWLRYLLLLLLIFQSALPRGERLNIPVGRKLINRFQSALPRGERLDQGDLFITWTYISIRAPARGATAMVVANSFTFKFQSALPRGERHYYSKSPSIKQRFQSALPRGERLSRPADPWISADFNPRSREGSDKYQVPEHDN